MAIKILLGTTNEQKIKEYKELFLIHKLEEFGYELITMDDLIEVDETGDTCRENSKMKAKAYVEKYKCLVITDDTGIFINVLNGAPGVHSKRYKGSTDVETSVCKIIYDILNTYTDASTKSLFTAEYNTAIYLGIPSEVSNMFISYNGVLHGSFSMVAEGEYSDILYDKHFKIKDMFDEYKTLALHEDYVQRTARAKAFSKLAEHLKDNNFSS